MKKININNNFFKDIVFNVYTYKKYLLIDKLLLAGGILINAISFFLYSLTGNPLFHEVDFYLRITNALLVSGIFAIYHRIGVNRLNISRELMYVDSESLFYPSIQFYEVLPLNFKLNDELPLSSLKKIYKEGAYVILESYSSEFVFFVKENDVYLIENDEEEIINEVKTLKLSR